MNERKVLISILLMLISVPVLSGSLTIGVLYAWLSSLAGEGPILLEDVRPKFLLASGLSLAAAAVAMTLGGLIYWRLALPFLHRLKDSEAHMRSIVETAVDAIITIDGAGKVLTFNSAAERIFGYSAGEIIGRNIRRLMPEPHGRAHDSYIQRYLKTGERKIIGIGREVQGMRKDGSVFPMDLSVSEIRLNNAVAFTGICRDITARKQVEDELREANRLLVEQHEKRLQAEKLSSVGLLAAGVAHEINNPLSGIMGCVQALRDNRVPDESREAYFNTVWNGLERIGITVRGLLDYARHREFHLRMVELEKAIQDSLRLVGPALQKKNVQVRVDIDGRSCEILADSRQLTQALVNILLNSVYELSHGDTITITAVRDGQGTAIHVTDSGPGFPTEHLDKLCDPFFSTKPEGEGTGLGLAVTAGIVRSHQGRLSFSNPEGGGACVTLWFPDAAIQQEVSSRS